jgi:hypothetical protein
MFVSGGAEPLADTPSKLTPSDRVHQRSGSVLERAVRPVVALRWPRQVQQRPMFARDLLAMVRVERVFPGIELRRVMDLDAHVGFLCVARGAGGENERGQQ